MEWFIWILLVIAGIAGGFFSGLFGIGGGIIYTIVFQAYFQSQNLAYNQPDTEVRHIIACSLFAVFFSGFIGTVRNIKAGKWQGKIIYPLVVGAMISSVLCHTLIKLWGNYKPAYFAAALCSLILAIVIRNTFFYKEKEQTDSKTNHWYLFCLGIATGVVMAFTGLGGGVLLVPFLNMIFGVKYKDGIAISLGFIAITSFFNSIYFATQSSTLAFQNNDYYIGLINLSMCFPVLIGVFVGTPIGQKTMAKVTTQRIKLGFFVFSMAMIMRILWATYIN